MNNISTELNKETMCSSQLAELLDFDKKEINKKIRSMFGEEVREKFSPTLRSNKQVDEYHLPELESKMFVAKHDITYLEKITQYWIDRNKLTPQSFSQALRLAADQQEAIEKLEVQAKLDAPIVRFGNHIVAKDEQLNIGTYSKLLSQEHGIKIGQNKLFKYLRDKGYLQEGRDARERNNPFQRYIQQGWFTVKVEFKQHLEVNTTLITGKGQLMLSAQIVDYFSK